MDKVYLIFEHDSLRDFLQCQAIVKTQPEAQKYVETHNKLANGHTSFFYEEMPIQTFDADVADYYVYEAFIIWRLAEQLRVAAWISGKDKDELTDEELENKYNHPDESVIQEEEPILKLDQGEVFVEHTDDHIAVYSKKSFEEARNKCLELWFKAIEELKIRS